MLTPSEQRAYCLQPCYVTRAPASLGMTLFTRLLATRHICAKVLQLYRRSRMTPTSRTYRTLAQCASNIPILRTVQTSVDKDAVA
eukprot:5263006-Pleurochrysis_carterae.AAC.2